jgi:trans-2,3-dihydro-3-hydroxyanthranilate isomerase
MKRHFVTVDVFTDAKFGGNPLAVLPDASGLSTEQMQAIAAEFNYAETTFVLPPKDARNTAHVRIFTPRAEMPFAGHPNVGTAFVLARLGKVSGDKIVFEEKAGLVPLDLTRSASTVVAARLAAPQSLSLGEEIAPALVAEATGLKPADIVGQPVIASTGNNFLFAEVASRAVLKAATYNLDVFTGVPEDPATGSANVTLIGLLSHRDPRPDLTLHKIIGQGFDMGRPSILEASAEKKAGKVIATYIGGKCTPMMSGTIEL